MKKSQYRNMYVWLNNNYNSDTYRGRHKSRKKAALAAQTEVPFKQKNSRLRFQYLETSSNQARYQYSAEFTSVFQ